MEILLSKILHFAIIIAFVNAIRVLLKKSKLLIILSIIIASIAFTFFTIFYLNKTSSSWGEEMKDFIGSNKIEKDDTAYKFIWDNFLLIDNSFDKELIPHPEIDSGYLTVTNRYKLLKLFQELNSNINNVDLVICDIGFGDSSENMQPLKVALQSLIKSDKLILTSKGNPEKENTFGFPDSIYGNILDNSKSKLFISHNILYEGYTSLPYKMYESYTNSRITNYWFNDNLLKDKNGLIANPFFPEFHINNEELLLDGYSNKLNDKEIDLNSDNSNNYTTIGRLIANPHTVGTNVYTLNSTLIQRKKQGKKNFVFIGSFKSENEDIHQTFFGNHHGSIILLNIFYSLIIKQHYINFWFVLYIFIFYLIIFFFLSVKCLGLSYSLNYQDNETNNNQTKIQAKDSEGYLRKIITSFYKLIKSFIHAIKLLLKEEPHFVFFFIFTFLTYYFWGKVINVLSIAIYIGMVAVAFKFTDEKKKN